MRRRSAAAEAVPSGAVNVLAGRWTSTRRHPETWSAVARGRKSAGVGVSALAQGDQAPAVCSPARPLPQCSVETHAFGYS